MAYRLMVTGSVACFRRPEFAHEDVTYDVISPLAARRLFESVHWTPAIWWRVDRIEVLHPIRTEWRQDRGAAGGTARALCLLDVSYLLVGRFEMTGLAGASDSAAQHAAMFRRRARGQRFFRPPDLGGRSRPATVRLVAEDEEFASAYAGVEASDLGWMIYDRDREDRERLRFYRPTMVRGVIDLASIDPATLPA